MNRRKFVTHSLEGTLGGLVLSQIPGSIFGASFPSSTLRDSLFESGNPQLVALADEIFQKCVIEKLI